MKRVRVSFMTNREGKPFVVSRGRLIDDDHPLVKKYPQHFEDLKADIVTDGGRYDQAIERATANPGERRVVVPAIQEEPEETDPSLPTEPIDPEDYSHAELKSLAFKAGISTGGTKEAIADRFNERF